MLNLYNIPTTPSTKKRIVMRLNGSIEVQTATDQTTSVSNSSVAMTPLPSFNLSDLSYSGDQLTVTYQQPYLPTKRLTKVQPSISTMASIQLNSSFKYYQTNPMASYSPSCNYINEQSFVRSSVVQDAYASSVVTPHSHTYCSTTYVPNFEQNYTKISTPSFTRQNTVRLNDTSVYHTPTTRQDTRSRVNYTASETIQTLPVTASQIPSQKVFLSFVKGLGTQDKFNLKSTLPCVSTIPSLNLKKMMNTTSLETDNTSIKKLVRLLPESRASGMTKMQSFIPESMLDKYDIRMRECVWRNTYVPTSEHQEKKWVTSAGRMEHKPWRKEKTIMPRSQTLQTTTTLRHLGSFVEDPIILTKLSTLETARHADRKPVAVRRKSTINASSIQNHIHKSHTLHHVSSGTVTTGNKIRIKKLNLDNLVPVSGMNSARNTSKNKHFGDPFSKDPGVALFAYNKALTTSLRLTAHDNVNDAVDDGEQPLETIALVEEQNNADDAGLRKWMNSIRSRMEVEPKAPDLKPLLKPINNPVKNQGVLNKRVNQKDVEYAHRKAIVGTKVGVMKEGSNAWNRHENTRRHILSDTQKRTNAKEPRGHNDQYASGAYPWSWSNISKLRVPMGTPSQRKIRSRVVRRPYSSDFL